MSTQASPTRNPVQLIAPGTRARLELVRGIAADVVRGASPGPIVWVWLPRGSEDPSLQQAAGELRDGLDPGQLRGAVGFLLDGPAPPVGREAYPLTAVARSICHEAAALILACGAGIGQRATPHAAAAIDAPHERRLARELALPYVCAPIAQAPLNRAILDAPVAWLIAGESDRVERAAADAARAALLALLVSRGLVPGEREPSRSSLLRRLSEVELTSPGLVELAVEPGALVRRHAVIGSVGPPGAVARHPILAPCSGVVLQTRAGHLLDGSVALLGRLATGSTPAPTPAALDELGWCELVDLPDLGVSGLPAKVDSGARTSALHVQRKRLVGRSARGRAIYELEIPGGDSAAPGERTVRVRVEVTEQSVVRDSGGHAERRPVIETRLLIGTRLRRVRVTLTDRGDMRFPMLIGRTALDARTRIDPTRSFLTRPTRRRSPR